MDNTLSQPPDSEPPSQRGERGLGLLLPRLVAGALLLLIGSTWLLWTPQDVFPRIPLFHFAIDLPQLADWLALATIIGGSVGLLVWPHGRWRLVECGMVCGGMVCSIVLDQHRLQPWAYQLLLMTVVLATARERTAIRLCRLLFASIYIYSAWSKLDYSFLAAGGTGERFVATLLGVAGVTTIAPATLTIGAWTIVIGEFLVGAMLLSIAWSVESRSATRAIWQRLAVSMGIALHVLLLLILGPLGMNHSLSVLLWNAVFIVLLIPLFTATIGPDGGNEAERKAGTWIACAVVCLALFLPLLEPFGLCDSWLAWSLYSSRNERALVTKVNPLSEHVLERVRIDLWSLESLSVPIYPENRFRVGVALWLCERNPDDEYAIELAGAADRWTGRRKSELFRGKDEIERAAADFWLNAQPRGK